MLKAFISWWYTTGWAWRAEQILSGLERTMDYFSIGLLAKTWFAPFRQIDAGKLANANIEMRMRKFFDRTFSRFIGAFMRTIVMLIGIIVITAKALFGLIVLLFWPILPVFPIISIIIFASGWTPQVLPTIQQSIKNFGSESSKSETKNNKKTDLFDLDSNGSNR